jgi:hypothetical protein
VISRGGMICGGGGVDGVSGLDHLGVESVVGVGGVVDGADGTVGLHQTVVSLDNITVAGLGLTLLVAGVGVVDAVLEGVVGHGLQNKSFFAVNNQIEG